MNSKIQEAIQRINDQATDYARLAESGTYLSEAESHEFHGQTVSSLLAIRDALIEIERRIK